MELSKNALTVLERRYLIKNGEGVVIETVEELFRRVAGATRIDFGFSTVDKQPKNDVTVTDDATLLFVFSVRKSGGIKL